MLTVALFLDSLFAAQHYEAFEVRPYDYLAEYLPPESRPLPSCAHDDLDITQELPAVLS